MKKAIIALAAAQLFSNGAFAANTEKYCNAISELATGYVEDRDYGWSYTKSLATADAAIAKTDLSPSDRIKYRRDIHASVKIAYVDFPQISKDGIYKLVQLGCTSE